MSTTMYLQAPQKQRWVLKDHALDKEYPVATAQHAHQIISSLPGILYTVSEHMVKELATRKKGRLTHRFTMDRINTTKNIE